MPSTAAESLSGEVWWALASKKSSTAPQSEVTKPWKPQSPRRMVFEEHLVGAGGVLIDGVVGAHDGVGLGVDDGGAEGGEVGVPEIVRGGVDVGGVAGGFGAAVDGVVLGRGDGLEVGGVVALQAFDEGYAEAAVRKGSSP